MLVVEICYLVLEFAFSLGAIPFPTGKKFVYLETTTKKTYSFNVLNIDKHEIYKQKYSIFILQVHGRID